MTIKQAAEVVALIHNSYPIDRKATPAELGARVENYAVMFADIDAEIVKQAARRWIATSKYMPTIQELYKSCSDVEYINACPITTETEYDATYDQWLEAFCKWVGLGYEPDSGEYPGDLPYEK